MREEATPWSSAAFAAAAGITAAACAMSVRRGGRGREVSGKARERLAEGRAKSQSAREWIEDVGGAVSSLARVAIARARSRGRRTPSSAFLRNSRRTPEGASSERAALTSIWCLAPNLPAAATIASPSFFSALGPAERNMVATRAEASREATRGATPVARRFAEAMVADIWIGLACDVEGAARSFVPLRRGRGRAKETRARAVDVAAGTARDDCERETRLDKNCLDCLPIRDVQVQATKYFRIL